MAAHRQRSSKPGKRRSRSERVKRGCTPAQLAQLQRARIPPRPLAARLYAKVILPLTSEGIPCDDPDQCWDYTGNCTAGKYGYGQIRGEATGAGKAKLVKAHRASFLVWHGPIPEGLEIAHACDRIVCINPYHLFAQTHVGNMHDYIRKYGGIGRRKSPISLDQLQLDLAASPGLPPVYLDPVDPTDAPAPV